MPDNDSKVLEQNERAHRTALEALEATRKAAATSLAGGIIAAAGRPFSMNEAMEVYRDAYFTLFPNPSAGRYQQWKGLHRSNKRYGPPNEYSPQEIGQSQAEA